MNGAHFHIANVGKQQANMPSRITDRALVPGFGEVACGAIDKSRSRVRSALQFRFHALNLRC
jgi:hypothetical protein